MALLDRVKERVESGLGDPELTSLIAEAQAEIRRRWGPDVGDPPVPLVVEKEGYPRQTLDFTRPIDSLDLITEQGSWDDPSPVDLAADDYAITNGGRTLERRTGGTNSSSRWARYVTVTYVPVDDTPQREEVVIKYVQLSVEYKGVSSERVGDSSTNYQDFTREKEKLFASLSARGGLTLA